MSQRKNPELDAKHQAILRKMMQMPENKTCADCKGPSPRWASTNLGIFLCISCSGIHRKLGTHISQVRSVTLDTWTPAQIAHFTKFGNARAAQYFEACIPPGFQRPPHGDAMQMERFIRDKYENKRYITIENGGRGGEAAAPSYRSSGSSYGGVLGPRPSQVSGTASYSVRGYDTACIKRGTGTYNSYGGRFGSGASELSHTRRMGGMLGQAASAPEIRRGNAMQRASTLKELINMGFSAQHAARAVEAAQGDLQKAVDWVLEHKDQGNQNNMSSFAPPPQQTPQRDLLDFDDPVPTPQVRVKANASQQARPKAMDTELLMSTTPTARAASKGTDDLADFADFGAFESALPATNKPSSESGNPATNGSFSSTIRNIYKQSPPQRAQPYLNGMPHMTRLDQSKQVASPQPRAIHTTPIRTTPSPKLMAQKAADASKKIPDTDLGLTSFTGLAKSQYMLSSPTTAGRLPHHPVSHGPTSAKPNGGEVPPPPPPQVEVSVPHMNSSYPPTPPPPDSPPPASPPPDSPVPPGENPSDKTKTSALEQKPKLGPSPVNPNPEQDEKEKTNSVEQSPPVEEEEEEDPFAALSMMAMTSAKTKTTKKNPAPHVSLQSKAGVVSGSPEQKGGAIETAATVKPINGIDLDELLG